jgi:hypothetical protein
MVTLECCVMINLTMKRLLLNPKSWMRFPFLTISLSFVIGIFLSWIPVSAQIIQPARMVDWSIAGYPGIIPDVPIVINVKAFGAIGDGISNDHAAIISAIDAASTPGAIFLPEGRYRINDTLQLKEGTVLRGAGAGKTFLECDLGGTAKNCIEILTYRRGEFVAIQSGLEKGSTTLVVANASAFKAGDIAEIQQENDPQIMYTRPEWNESWAQNAVGQFVRILSVEGNTLTLDRPLHIDFNPALNPVIRTNGLIANVGIEDLHIQRLDAGDGHTILIKNAIDSWVRRVESAYTYRSHVNVASSMNIEIRDSYFHHSHDYGGGGHGYGVDLNSHTTNCLVENNIFEHLRHSMMVHVGANGNVFGYNYSFDPFQNDGTWTPNDISVHGHYPFMNLFEGNILQKAGSSDWWGPAGPGMTFFRNRIEAENLALMDYSHNQNVVGNEFTGETNGITLQPEIQGTLVHGNNIRGQVSWDQSILDHVLPDSYYLTEKPGFYKGLSWPSLGGDQVIGAGTLPAVTRYEAGEPVPSIDSDTTFIDVPQDHWAYEYIEILYKEDYISGCSTDLLMYCPEESMTRAEGAVFVLRGENGGGYLPTQPSAPLFADTPMEAWYTKWADELYQEGFTSGCGTDPLNFCPLQTHSIAEASVFFVRIKHNPYFYPAEPQHIFSDIPQGAWYERWVEQAYLDGLFLPCQTNPTLKACPEEPITRAMAAYMMVQAKDLMPPEMVIFVDNSVQSSGDGSIDAPFKTIREGLEAAIAGDTIYIRGDAEGREYNESLIFPISGTVIAPITLRSYPGEQVIIASSSMIFRLDQPYWHFVDLIFDHKNGAGDALQIRGGHNALFRNVEIKNGQKYGIQIFDGNNVVIENSRIHSFDTGVEGNDAHCICTDPTNTAYNVENLQLLNNIIYDCSGDGIQFYAVDSTPMSEYARDILLQGNTFYKNPGFYGENAIDSKGAENVRVLDNEIYGFDSNKAVVLQKGSSNFHFEGNIIHDSHRGIEMRGEGGKSQSGHAIVRNIFYNIYGEYVIKFDDVDLGIVQHNTVVNNDSEFIRIEEEGLIHGDIRNNLIVATGRPKISGIFEADFGFNGWFSSDPGTLAQATDIVGTNPLFANPSSQDFHLQEGSPAIDAGTDLGEPYHGDAPDLGAFER